jgi:fused signal recognition particle receptor
MPSWLGALKKTREALARWWQGVGGGRAQEPGAATEASPAALEQVLIAADVGPRLAAELCRGLSSPGAGDPVAELERRLIAKLDVRIPPKAYPPPTTILLVGTNGSGKTTTAAKLAVRYMREGRRPLLCASDTFRAAGAVQLQVWAERIGCEVIAGAPGADPAAVAFDALEAAHVRGADPLIIDTAGRMHTREPLMRQLDKIRRALGKRKPGAPEEVWLVLDATLGRNALAQARAVLGVVPLTGVVVTKLDGSARAGFVGSIVDELNVPILWVGMGESAEDLVPFDPVQFVRGLLGRSDASDART